MIAIASTGSAARAIVVLSCECGSAVWTMRVSHGGTDLAGNGSVHIICLGNADWGRAPAAAHALTARLARRGHQVLYVNASANATSADGALFEPERNVHVISLPATATSGAIPPRDARRARWLLSRAARRVGLRGPVGVSFGPDGEWLRDAPWAAGLVRCRRVERAADPDGSQDWEVAADAVIRRLQATEDAAAHRRRAGRGPAAGPPHARLHRRRATLSWKAQLAFAGSVAAGWGYYFARLCWRAVMSRGTRSIRRILIVRPRCHLGDLIVLLPMLAALRGRFPDAHIALAAQPGMPAAGLLASTRYVDAIRVLDHLEPLSTSTEDRPALARLAGALELYAEGYDLVISGATYFLQREPFFGGAPFRVGFDEGHPLQALNNVVIPFDPSRHEADNNLRLAQLVGADLPPHERAPRLPPDTHAAARWMQLREALQLQPGVPVLTVHPGSKMPTRRWPADRFARLVSTLLRERPALHVVFSGVAGEVPLVDDIITMIDADLRTRARSAAGLTDLSGLRGLLEHSVALVCNDTGSMHLGRAVGTPIVALMGPENHLRWGPYPEGSAPAVLLRHEVPCAPCRREHCEPFYCMRSLAEEEALAAVRAVLDGTHQGTTVQVHLQRHSWRELAAQGFELPTVTVVVLPEAACGHPAHAQTAGARAQEFWRVLQQQDYPRWDVLFAEGGTVIGAFERAVREAVGQFVVPLMAVPRWRPARLGDDIALLVRDPLLLVAADGRPGHEIPSRLTDVVPFCGATLRRDAILERLPEPAPQVRFRSGATRHESEDRDAHPDLEHAHARR